MSWQTLIVRRGLSAKAIPHDDAKGRRRLNSDYLWIGLAFVGALPIYFVVARVTARFALFRQDVADGILALVVTGLLIWLVFRLGGRQGADANRSGAVVVHTPPQDSAQSPADVEEIPPNASQTPQAAGDDVGTSERRKE